METISLAINSHKPVIHWFEKTLKTAVGFDEIVLYIQATNAETIEIIKSWNIDNLTILHDGGIRSIKDGFNYAISKAKSDWVCSFCDDDWFIEEKLSRLLGEIRSGRYINKDIIHFKVQTENGFTWGADNFTIEGLRETNQIPHGSFIRKEFFDKIGGYKTDCGSDWNLWIRAMEAGARFENFEDSVYIFRTFSERSAYEKQLREHGGIGGMRHTVNVVK